MEEIIIDMPTLTEDEEFCYEHRAQYYETDQMGIVHHSNYIRWMEERGLPIWNLSACLIRRWRIGAC